MNQSLSASTISAGDVILTVSGEASNSETKITLKETVIKLKLARSFELENETEAMTVTATPVEEMMKLKFKETGKPDVDAVSIKGGILIEKLNNSAATGNKIEGNTDIKLVKLTTTDGSVTNNADLSLQKIAFNNMKITNSQGEYVGLNVALTIDNAATFDTFAFLHHQPVIKFHVNNEEQELTFDPTSVAIYRGNVSNKKPCNNIRD